MATFAFSGAVAETPAYGQKQKVRFVSTWANADTWSIDVNSSALGNATLGKGNIAGQTFAACFKLRNRMYLAFGSSFALSANGDVTAWEEQNSGTAVVPFLSQFGAQDSVKAFASIQGRLGVFGAQSIQMWSIDADPNNFALQQTLENSGTVAPLSVKSIGDLDVLYLDSSGIRSLRAKESTLNAFINDIGTAIDLTIRDALISFDESTACAVVDPATRQYWLYLNGTIYVLSYYPQSKVTAWSTFQPTVEATMTPVDNVFSGIVEGGIYYWTKGTETSLIYNNVVYTASTGFVGVAGETLALVTDTYSGTLVRVDTEVTPEKFVVYNGQIYFRASDRKIYRYGGSNNNTYDHCRATVELPWLDMGQPGLAKAFNGIDAAFKGNWSVQASANPRTVAMTTVIDRGSATSPSVTADSTFDVGHFGFSANGTHLKLKCVSGIVATAAKLGKLAVHFNSANTK